MPTRDEFSDFGAWNPYYALTPDAFTTLSAESPIVQRCPPFPAGFDQYTVF